MISIITYDCEVIGLNPVNRPVTRTYSNNKPNLFGWVQRDLRHDSTTIILLYIILLVTYHIKRILKDIKKR